MKSKPIGFIVVWDDRMGVCVPQGLDAECMGGLCSDEPAAFFHDRKLARLSIEISKAFAALRKAQGLPYNHDYVGDALKNVRIVPLMAVSRPPKEEKR